MNRDAKVGILILIVICSGWGFVLLAAPSVTTASSGERQHSLFSSDKKNSPISHKSFLDEDLSIEMMNHLDENKGSSVENDFSKTEAFSVISKNDKNITNNLPEKMPLNQKNKEVAIESRESLINPSKKLSNSLDNGLSPVDTIKVTEIKEAPNKLLEKPLEPKVLEDVSYIVKEGDTLSSIAKSHYQESGKYQLIIDANKGLNTKDLKIGMKIILPGTESQKKMLIISKPFEKPTMAEPNKTVLYKVESGDTIYSIAKNLFGNNYSMTDIKNANPEKNLSRLKIGEIITLPGQGTKK